MGVIEPLGLRSPGSVRNLGGGYVHTPDVEVTQTVGGELEGLVRVWRRAQNYFLKGPWGHLSPIKFSVLNEGIRPSPIFDVGNLRIKSK
jgi:hypothetical protein